MNIVLIGKTGCGKTTLAQLLADQYGIPHVSSGDIARELGDQDATTRNVLERGLFAPEEAMRIQVKQKLETAQLEHGGFVIEGFPRTVAQMIAVSSWSKSIPTFIHLTCSTIECIHRLIERGREDDNADALARKFETYEETTMRMVDILKEGGTLHEVESSRSPQDTFIAVQKILAV